MNSSLARLQEPVDFPMGVVVGSIGVTNRTSAHCWHLVTKGRVMGYSCYMHAEY